LQSKAFQNIRNLGFLVWKYSIWQPWSWPSCRQQFLFCCGPSFLRKANFEICYVIVRPYVRTGTKNYDCIPLIW
jgi:hypothetical protein